MCSFQLLHNERHINNKNKYLHSVIHKACSVWLVQMSRDPLTNCSAISVTARKFPNTNSELFGSCRKQLGYFRILVLIKSVTRGSVSSSTICLDQCHGQTWTRCVRFGQSQKKLTMSSSHKHPQESFRKVKSHKIVTLKISSHKTLPMRLNRHIALSEAHGPTDGRTTDRRLG